jgi:hypothetical protein
MMTSFLSKHSSFISHKEPTCDFKTYVMFRNGLYKTCGRGKALELLRDGWHDRTQYKPKQEVLNNVLLCTELEATGRQPNSWSTRKTSENYDSSERQHETMCGGSDSSSERKEPGHKQHQSDTCNSGGTELTRETLRSGTSHSQVIKKRGRPKRGT